MEEIKWVIGTSSGVPFLFCPGELAPFWEAMDTPTNGRVVEASFRFEDESAPATDYDRACDLAKDYVQSISIATGDALLLGEEIPFATWIEASSFTGGYILIPEFWSEDEPDYPTVIEEVAAQAFSPTSFHITAADSGFVLFPATDRVEEQYASLLKVNCQPGRYAVSIAFWVSDTLEFRLIKLERTA